MRTFRHVGVVRPGPRRAFCLSTALGPAPFRSEPLPGCRAWLTESRGGYCESPGQAHTNLGLGAVSGVYKITRSNDCGRFNAPCADARGAVQRTFDRPRKRCAAEPANSIFLLFVSALGRRRDRAWTALHAALRERRRRRIATTLDNPQRGLNLVPRIATIELKKDGPDLAGGDWG